MKRNKLNICFFVMLGVAVLITGAIGVDYLLFRLIPPKYTGVVWDQRLGWRLSPNTSLHFPQKTLKGEQYDVLFETDADGLRTFGTNKDAAIQIIILGDSFTGGLYASNDKMWYAKMVEALALKTGRILDDVYVRAGGAGGYGTYQNVLLAEELRGKFRPTLFIHQFCSNDFYNNTLEWESEGFARNQFMLRPYFNPATNHAEYYNSILARAYRHFAGKSRIVSELQKIDIFLQGLQFQLHGGEFPNIEPARLERFEKESIAITSELLVKLRANFPEVPAVLVNCSPEKTGPNQFWMDIARDAGFTPVSAPSDFLGEATAQGWSDVYNIDGAHMSEKGNKAYGELLADALISTNIIARSIGSASSPKVFTLEDRVKQ